MYAHTFYKSKLLSGKMYVFTFSLFAHTFAGNMDKKTLTPIEAWDDFDEYIRRLPGFKIPNEVSTARRDRRGERTDRYDRKIWLGPSRIERILNKYAPGRYTFTRHTVVTLNEGE